MINDSLKSGVKHACSPFIDSLVLPSSFPAEFDTVFNPNLQETVFDVPFIFALKDSIVGTSEADTIIPATIENDLIYLPERTSCSPARFMESALFNIQYLDVNGS